MGGSELPVQSGALEAMRRFEEKHAGQAAWAECPKSRNRRHWYVGYPRHQRRCRWCGKPERGPF